MQDLKNFVIDPYCDDVFNYFGLSKLISTTSNESLLTCHIKTILNTQLSSSTENSFWIDELNQCQIYKSIGNFGDLKFLQNHNPICVVKENFKSLSILLELELYKKTKSSDPIVLPIHFFQNHLFVFTVYEIKTLACDVKSLSQRKNLSSFQISYVVFNMLKGLEFLHKHKIVLRNLRAENVFVFENQIKIGNFSSAVLENATMCCTEITKIFPYCSPDYFTTSPKITTKTDIWSVGVFTCELWTKTAGTPFVGQGVPGSIATADSMLNLKLDSNLVAINEKEGILLTIDQLDFLQLCLNQNYSLRGCVNTLLRHCSLKLKNVLFE